MQPVEPDISEMSLVDARDPEALTIAMRRQILELTGAAIITIAITELNAFEIPVCLRHGFLSHNTMGLNVKRHLPGCGQPINSFVIIQAMYRHVKKTVEISLHPN